MPRKIQLQRVQPIRGVVTSKVRVTSEKIKIVIIIMIFIISSRKNLSKILSVVGFKNAFNLLLS